MLKVRDAKQIVVLILSLSTMNALISQTMILVDLIFASKTLNIIQGVPQTSKAMKVVR
jgi:hypothetical protein